MKILSSLMAVWLLCLSCTRPMLNQDEQQDPEGTQSSYYSKPGTPATTRIEKIGQPKKRLIVLDLWNDTPIANEEFGRFAADELRRGLYVSQRVIVPKDVKSHFQTKDFIQGARVNVEQLIREGRRLSVAVCVVGRIKKIVVRQKGDDVGVLRHSQTLAAVDIELKMFDVNAGREIAAIGQSGEAAENALIAFEDRDVNSPNYRAEVTKLALRDAMSKLAPGVVQSVDKMQWEGRVAKILGNKVYLNSGKSSGLVAGDILKVLTSGDDVYDPASGAYLGRTEGQLKGTLEVVDFIGDDAAVAKPHTGGHFIEGDVVRLY